jgi:dihydrofolate reductase
MGKVFVQLSMSLDGFVAGPNDGPENGLGDGGVGLFAWYMNGDVEFPLPGTEMKFYVSQASADLLATEFGNIGAMVAGRRMFDIAQAWGGHPPGGGPCLIMTHNPPDAWLHEGSPFTFITDGIESAIQEARRQAGDGAIALSSASVMQQALKAGLLDEVRIDLAPVLIGGGVRLFEHFGDGPVELEPVAVIEGQGVTHLRYGVVG